MVGRVPSVIQIAQTQIQSMHTTKIWSPAQMLRHKREIANEDWPQVKVLHNMVP